VRIPALVLLLAALGSAPCVRAADVAAEAARDLAAAGATLGRDAAGAVSRMGTGGSRRERGWMAQNVPGAR